MLVAGGVPQVAGGGGLGARHPLFAVKATAGATKRPLMVAVESAVSVAEEAIPDALKVPFS